jgi:hydrogenase nickel incorporation protein HypA/HybF
MHEFSAACSIIEAAVEAANQHNVKKVMAVNVQVGEFTFLVPDQLEFNFQIASQKTLLEGAKLNIEMVKGRLRCQECGYEGEADADPNLPPQVAVFAPMKCPNCTSAATEISGGKEFVITNLEAELETT